MIPLLLMLAAGAVDPAVTQANIATTICTSGYTATVRPSSSYTSNLKAQQIADEGLPGSYHDYVEDHVIPLELGGAPRDPANLRPQAVAQAAKKDVVEDRMHTLVCAGTLTLAQGQAKVLDWVDTYDALFGVWP